MKKQIFYLIFLFFTMWNTITNVQAQCDIAQLTIADSTTTKSLRGYIQKVYSLNPQIIENLTSKKTAIVLLEETRHGVAGKGDEKAFEVVICESDFFKYRKMTINGYFELDNVLYLVTSPLFGSFKTDNYNYDNPCLSKILSKHSLREFKASKWVKKQRNNVEIEVLEQGDKLNIYGCIIIPNLKGKGNEGDYSLLFTLD
ncbi:hypothetical protein [Arcicella lustrica]|uniref:Uncharacterized protein n=1 Tax=Arcicella lustrica TaxID=2984196 RepID=A0ABU5SM14_9BACT|nr:hypothetical protein [Arcicella sp. DC25W]MEA5428360.1 hypothetical protein [Arcicella sp. DC25W]